MQHMFPGHCKGVNKLQYGTCRGSSILCLYSRTLAFKHKLQDWSPQQQQQQRWKHPNAWADFCRKLKHFKQIHTVPCFCRTLTRLVNVHAFALCRPKISLNGCSISALTLFLSTAHMVLTTTTCSCTLHAQSYRVRLGKDCLQLSVWSMLQVCPSTCNSHFLAFAAMLFLSSFWVTGELATLRHMIKVPNEPGLSPNNGQTSS